VGLFFNPRVVYKTKKEAYMLNKKYHPGNLVPVDGIYAVQTAFGLRTKVRIELIQGDKFPPIVSGDYSWVFDEALEDFSKTY
jgi:hypothetical protein